jgi:hypothetical protein
VDNPPGKALEHRDANSTQKPESLTTPVVEVSGERQIHKLNLNTSELNREIEIENGKLIQKGHLPEVHFDQNIKMDDSELKEAKQKAAQSMVVVPDNFDPKSPINLVIYNHGWNDTASSSLSNANLSEQMKNAPANTVLIVPEWQKNPGTGEGGGSDQGKFGDENFASNLVQDAMDRTPELKGKTLADINHIGIISHSAGYVPTESELYHNPELAKKVNSVTLLDSLYDGHGFDKWIHENIGDLSAGTKHFQNIFKQPPLDGHRHAVSENSHMQAQFVAEELKKYNGARGSDSELVDYDSTQPLTAQQLKAHPIVFKSTSMKHMEMPKNYVAIVEEAAAAAKKPPAKIGWTGGAEKLKLELELEQE